MKKIAILSLLFALPIATFTGCSVANVLGSINPTDVSTDKELGAQMYAQIASDPKNYPLLDEKKYAEAYGHVRRIATTILNSGVVEHRDVFDWSVMIIDADNVQNAFACPGGKLYVYTGLIKYLDNEAQLAGVMAHEIAHAAARHSSRQIFQNNSIAFISSLILGEKPSELSTMVAQIAGGMGGLAFSRKDESEADNLAVYYLSHTDYNPLGVAGFFEKLQATGMGSEDGIATYFSTHPASADRIQQIHEAWKAYGSRQGNDFTDRYRLVKNSLNVR